MTLNELYKQFDERSAKLCESPMIFSFLHQNQLTDFRNALIHSANDVTVLNVTTFIPLNADSIKNGTEKEFLKEFTDCPCLVIYTAESCAGKAVVQRYLHNIITERAEQKKPVILLSNGHLLKYPDFYVTLNSALADAKIYEI